MSLGLFQDGLINAGEMTSEIHQSLMRGKYEKPIYAGLYVSEDIGSPSAYGNNLIQVEVDPGYRFLHASNEVRIKLRKQGISKEDVYRLGSQLAVPDPLTSDPLISIAYSWWILKAREGIKFQPFSTDGISLKELEEAYERLEETAPRHYSGPFRFLDKPFSLSKKRQYFESLIREDILNRTEKSAAVFRGPFVKIVEDEHGRKYVVDRVRHHNHHIESLTEAVRWVKYASNYLSDADKRRIVERTKQLPIRAMDYDGNTVSSTEKFHSELDQIKGYLSDSEYREFYRKFRAREQISINERVNEGTCISPFAD